jgi:trimeric autotransporter adhesin
MLAMLPRTLTTSLFLAASAVAQCALQPQATGRGVPSLDSAALRLTRWDPDGSGPLGERIVVAGNITLAGDLPVRSVAALDPVTDQWTALGDPGGVPVALAVLPGGLLVAGGVFSPPALLQVWTGTSWNAAVPQPPGSSLTTLAVGPSGNLFAVTTIGFGSTVHRFDGISWQALGTATAPTIGPASVRALTFAANGDLLVGGSFQVIGGLPVSNVARWDGSSWSAVGALGTVYDLLVTAGGELVAGGLFSVPSPSVSTNVARWDGLSWQALGTGTQSVLPAYAGVFALAELANGDLVAAGQFQAAGGVPAFKVARWNGSTWSAMGGGIEQFGPTGEPSTVFALESTATGEVFAAGNFGTVSGRDGRGLARWNGAAWRPARASGIGSAASAVHRTVAGEVFLGGQFRDIDGVLHNGIARRVGNGWAPVGAGIADFGVFGPGVAAITSLPSGELVVGGSFPGAVGVPSPGLVAWNGSAWAPLGGGLAGLASPPQVEALHVAANGDLLVAGVFDAAGGATVESVARWSGSAWSSIGSGLTSSGQLVSIRAVTTAANGDVYVAGWFPLGGFGPTAKIARFDGISWQVIGGCDGNVLDLRVLPNGDLLAAGAFKSIDGVLVGCVARRSNGVWSSFGGLGQTLSSSNVASDLRLLPGGAVLAAGAFEQGGSYYAFARWDGSVWTRFHDEQMFVLDLAVDPNGEVLVAGNFNTVGGVASASFARLVAPCAATANAGGAGCSGSGGLNTLTAESLPWLGGTFTARATGLAVNSLASIVLGSGTLSLPLAAILPQAGPGCSLLVTPDVLLLGVPAGGSLPVSFLLPSNPTLVGSVLNLQVVPLEFGVGGGIASVTATNRLTLLTGVF